MTVKRVMPPSVRYSWTRSAFWRPECGRDWGAFSTWTIAGGGRFGGPPIGRLGADPPQKEVVLQAASTAAKAGSAHFLLNMMTNNMIWARGPSSALQPARRLTFRGA